MKDQPVSNVVWRNRDELKPNDYNPNKVAPPELELLILSILEDGWTQPIVILPDMTIVDGFHRYTVSSDERLIAKFKAKVPTVMIDVDPVHRKMSTIRHNRARGTHSILPMSDIVKGMIDQGVGKKDVMRRLQMEREEVDRLIDRAGSPERVFKDNKAFRKSWVPK